MHDGNTYTLGSATTVTGIGVISCNNGFMGTPSVAQCAVDGGNFSTLSGCVEKMCAPLVLDESVEPANASMLFQPPFGLVSPCQSGQVLSPVTDNRCHVVCAENYSVPADDFWARRTDPAFLGVKHCAAYDSNDAAATGLACTAIVCDTADQTGYDQPTEEQLDLVQGFHVRTTCALDHRGLEAVATPCDSHGSAYNLSGCAPNPCTDVTPRDATECVLSPTPDFGVTNGSCADIDSDVATCVYVAGMFSASGNLDTVSTADSCTSTTAVGGVVAQGDTTNCALSATPDFGVTEGVCAEVNSTHATCSYVVGTFSASGNIDTVNTTDSCTSSVARWQEVTVPGDAYGVCAGRPDAFEAHLENCGAYTTTFAAADATCAAAGARMCTVAELDTGLLYGSCTPGTRRYEAWASGAPGDCPIDGQERSVRAHGGYSRCRDDTDSRSVICCKDAGLSTCTVPAMNVPAHATVDAACAPGSTLRGGDSCNLTCAPGYVPAGTQPSCRGQRQFDEGNMLCAVECQAGEYTDAPGSACIGCPAGRYADTVGTTTVSGHELRCGRLHTCAAELDAKRVDSDASLHAVGCCADQDPANASQWCTGTWPIDGGSSQATCPVWAQGGAEDCADMTYTAAYTYCQAMGARLCTTQEVEANCLFHRSCARYVMVWTSSQTGCTDCAAGKYSAATSATAENDCIACSTGKYTNVKGSTSACIDCPPGRYADATGEPYCSECSAGTYIDSTGSTDASQCIACAAGQYSDPGFIISWGVGPSLGLCEPGTKWSHRDLGAAACVSACPAGKISDASNSLCEACPKGKYAEAAGSTLCTNCEDGKTHNQWARDSTTFCGTCPKGKYGLAGVCLNCAAGQFLNITGGTQCLNCTVGKYVHTTGSDAEADCIDCAFGKYVTVAGSDEAGDCNACPSGRSTGAERVSSTHAHGNQQSTHTLGSQRLVVQVDVHHAANSNLIGTKVYVGTTANRAHASSVRCGTVTTALFDSVLCEHGVWGRFVMFQHVNPPANNAAKQVQVFAQPAGYLTAGSQHLLRDNADDCLACASGCYQPAESASMCLLCGTGRHLNGTASTNSTDCLDCGPGKKSAAGSPTCIVCGAGQYSPASTHTCTNCGQGKFLETVQSVSESQCILCEAGQYGDSVGSGNMAECKDCAAGRYSSDPGITSAWHCSECTAGKYLNATGGDNETDCVSCVAGKYMPPTQSTGVAYKRWDGIGGGTMQALVAHRQNGIMLPDSTATLTSLFESPTNVCNNCSTEMTAYFRTRQAGPHVFSIAADDNAELYFDGSLSPIAFVPGHTGSRQWQKYPNQTSEPQHLVTGTTYLIKAIAKEGGGGDNLAVAVMMPDGTHLAPIPVQETFDCSVLDCTSALDWNESMTVDSSTTTVHMRIAGGGARGVLEVSINGDQWGAVCASPAAFVAPAGAPDPCSGSGVALTDAGDVYRLNYGHNEDCTWTLTCSDPSLRPRLDFSEFNTESTNFDWVKVFDTDVSTTSEVDLHGGDLSSSLPTSTVTGNSATVEFHSDGSSTRSGFHAAFSCVDSAALAFCGSMGFPSRSSAMVHDTTLGNRTYELGSVHCAGGSSNISSCSASTFTTSSGCPTDRAVGLDCGGPANFKYLTSDIDSAGGTAEAQCTSCGIGKYSTAAGSASPSNCIDCQAGTYVEVSGSDHASDCIDCAAGKYSTTSGSVSIGHCVGCVAGKYVEVTGSDAATDCIGCVAGKYLNVPGSDALSDCIDCVAGKYIDVTGSNEASDCINCVAGKYIETDSFCSTMGFGLSACGDHCVPTCNVYGIVNDEASDCRDCVVGKYIDATGSDEASDCIDCIAGKYVEVASSDAEADCIVCVVGKYSAVVGSALVGDCTDCAAGRYIDVTGSDNATDCIDCVLGKYVDVAGSDNATACIACVAGKYIDATGSDAASDCIDCIAGKYVSVAGSDAAADCIDCVAGRYIDVSGSDQASDCIDCVAGKYVDVAGSDNAMDCIDCPLGRHVPHSGSFLATDCTGCMAGQYSINTNVCSPCVAGRYMLVNGSSDASDCIGCTVGKYSLAIGSSTADHCVDCVAGKFVNNTGSDDASDCINCVAGKYIDVTGSDDATDCIDCIAGTYVSAAGSDNSTACINCGAGRFAGTVGNDNAMDCCGCGAGKYGVTLGSTNDGDCIQCPASSSSVNGSASKSACLCEPGLTDADNTTNDSAISCRDCPAGMSGATDRGFAGPTGWSGGVNEDVCLPCAAGRYKPHQGSPGCILCPANKTSLQGATARLDCFCSNGFFASPSRNRRLTNDTTLCFSLPAPARVQQSDVGEVPLVSVWPEWNGVVPPSTTDRIIVAAKISGSGSWQLQWTLYCLAEECNSSAPIGLTGSTYGTTTTIRARTPTESATISTIDVVTSATVRLAVSSGVLHSSLHGPAEYRFALQATRPLDGSVVEPAVVAVFVNAAPAGGKLSVSPTAGMAVRDVFTLSAFGWSDQDMPLVYRFVSFSGQSNNTVSLTARMSNSSVTLSLSADQDAKHVGNAQRLRLGTVVYDNYGAGATCHNNSLLIEPYRFVIATSGNSSFSSVARDTLAQVDSTDTFAVQRMVQAFSTSLGANRSDDTLETRELLLDTLSASAASVFTPSARQANMSDEQKLVVAEAVSGMIGSISMVTGAAEQLSPKAMDEGIALLGNLSEVGLRPEDAESAAMTISNLLSATAFSFAEPPPPPPTPPPPPAADAGQPADVSAPDAITALSETEQEREEARQRQARADTAAAERGERLLSILENIAVASTAGSAEGEAPVVIETELFSLAAQTASAQDLETQGLTAGDSKVDLPTGALGNSAGPTTAQVVKWTGAGPHFWAGNALGDPNSGSGRRLSAAAECSPGQACRAGVPVLATDALTVSFFANDGSKLAVAGLETPAAISLPATDYAPAAVPDTISTSVVVPVGVVPGQRFGITLSNGTKVLHDFPDDVIAGDVILVAIPVVRETTVFCSSWDTSARAWKDEGLGMIGADGAMTCGTSHFTDFAAFVGNKPQSNTIKLGSLFNAPSDNSTGFTIALSMLIVGVCACTFSWLDYCRHAKRANTQHEKFQDHGNEFASARKAAKDTTLPWSSRMLTACRMQWLVGGILVPILGDPYLRSQRLFVLLLHIMVNLGLSIVFYQDQCAELNSEGACGEGNCSWTVLLQPDEDGTLHNARFSCSARCEDRCVSNRTADGMCIEPLCNPLLCPAEACPAETFPNGLLTSLLCACMTVPLIGFLNVGFSWVQRPLTADIMIRSGEGAEKLGEVLAREGDTAKKPGTGKPPRSHTFGRWCVGIVRTLRNCCNVQCHCVRITLGCHRPGVTPDQEDVHESVKVNLVAMPRDRARVCDRRRRVAQQMKACERSVDSMFELYDRDRNGTLDRLELRELMSELNGGTSVADGAIEFVIARVKEAKEEAGEARARALEAPGEYQIHVRGIGVDGWDGTPDGIGRYETGGALREIFSEFGNYQNSMIRHRIENGVNSSWALVRMGDAASVDEVLEAHAVTPMCAGSNPLVLTRYSNEQAAESTGEMARMKVEALAEPSNMSDASGDGPETTPPDTPPTGPDDQADIRVDFPGDGPLGVSLKPGTDDRGTDDRGEVLLGFIKPDSPAQKACCAGEGAKVPSYLVAVETERDGRQAVGKHLGGLRHEEVTDLLQGTRRGRLEVTLIFCETLARWEIEKVDHDVTFTGDSRYGIGLAPDDGNAGEIRLATVLPGTPAAEAGIPVPSLLVAIEAADGVRQPCGREQHGLNHAQVLKKLRAVVKPVKLTFRSNATLRDKAKAPKRQAARGMFGTSSKALPKTAPDDCKVKKDELKPAIALWRFLQHEKVFVSVAVDKWADELHKGGRTDKATVPDFKALLSELNEGIVPSMAEVHWVLAKSNSELNTVDVDGK